MASEKAALAKPPSAPPELPSEAYPASDNREPHAAAAAAAGMPTVEDPFNFPTDEPLPAYSAYPTEDPAAQPPPSASHAAGPSSAAATTASLPPPPPPPPSLGGPPPPAGPSSSSSPRAAIKPVAIPQVVPDASSPFIPAYPPCLLARGITEPSWMSFLQTASAFLTATVGDRAVRHAGDMAKHLASDTTNLGKDLASHGRSLGRGIARHARRGNVLGAAATLVSGAVSLPLMAAFGVVGTATRLPGAAVGAVTKKPKTPAERVNAYAAVANGRWLHARGLHALLVDTPGLARVLGLPAEQLLAVARSGKEGSASGMLRALDLHIESLEVPGDVSLGLSDRSLWLVVVDYEGEEEGEEEEDLEGEPEEERWRRRSRRNRY